MEIPDISLMQLGLAAIGVVAVFVVAMFMWRVLKKAIGGCVATGVGCLALVIGLVAIGLFLASQLGIADLSDIMDLIGQ